MNIHSILHIIYTGHWYPRAIILQGPGRALTPHNLLTPSLRRICLTRRFILRDYIWVICIYFNSAPSKFVLDLFWVLYLYKCIWVSLNCKIRNRYVSSIVTTNQLSSISYVYTCLGTGRMIFNQLLGQYVRVRIGRKHNAIFKRCSFYVRGFAIRK